MIINKDIRVENGNLILNGDKFPLDGQSPEAIMEIVEDNSDTTPTENSTAPVTSGGIKTYIDTTIGDLTQTGITGADVATQLAALVTALTYAAGEVITAENVVECAVGANTKDCYFSVPISKPVIASSVAISDVTCKLYYGTNQMEVIEGATYTATIENGSLLVKIEKANTFSQYGRYIVDFNGTFTFS